MRQFENATLETTASLPDGRSKLSFGIIFTRLLISIVAWSIHAVVTWILLFVYVDVAALVREDVEEFEIGLPAVSEFALLLSSALTNYSYLLILALIVINGPLAIGACYVPKRFQWVAWVWFTSYLVVAIALLALACLGLVMPFIDVSA